MIRLILLLVLISGCASEPIPEGMKEPEAKTILRGKNGNLKWGFTLDLGIIEPIEVKIWGNRSKAETSDEER